MFSYESEPCRCHDDLIDPEVTVFKKKFTEALNTCS